MNMTPPEQELKQRWETIDWIVQHALEGAIADGGAGSASDTTYDLFVLMARDEPYAAGQMGLDMLATQLSDTFGKMRLSPPTGYNADVMLHAQVVGPGSDAVRAGLESALVFTMQAFVGEEANPSIAVRPVGMASDRTVTLQIAFPRGTDPERFADGFSTRDYFLWQLDLGEMSGVGAVTSEPCTVLGALLPTADIIPPNLMISFAAVSDLEETIQNVLRDLDHRLARAIQPTEVMVGVSLSIQESTPMSIRYEIERWRARGYTLLDHDEEAFVRSMETTSLLFEFPIGLGPDDSGSSSDDDLYR
jgi:hypothetical protein